MEHTHMVMDRQIFNLGLSVEATSVYILVTSLVSENARPSLDLIRAKWNSTEEALDNGLAELRARSVLQHQTASDGQELYYPNPASLWR